MRLTNWEFKNLVHYASKDQTKVHLNSIFIDVAGKAVVSTGGHALIKIDLSNLNEDSIDFDKNTLIEVPRVTIKKIENVRLYNDNGIIKLDVINSKTCMVVNTVICKVMDLNYPDYNRVIPIIPENSSYTGVKTVKINPVYLPVDTKVIQFIFNESSLDPMLLKVNTIDNRSTIVLMPMR